MASERFCPSCGAEHIPVPYHRQGLAAARELLEIPRKSPHIGHQKHLCYLAESGECSLEEIGNLVKDAKFICRKCGRVAAAEENLCEPVTL